MKNINRLFFYILLLVFAFSCEPNSKEPDSSEGKEKLWDTSDEKCSCSKVFSQKMILDTLEKYIKSTTKIYTKEIPPSLYHIDFDRKSTDTFMTFSSFYFMPEIVPHMKGTVKIIGYCKFQKNDIVIIDRLPFFGAKLYNNEMQCNYQEIENKYFWDEEKYLLNEDYREKFVNPMWKFQINNKNLKLIKITNRVALE